MPIICSEGPSAVGKTATADAFRADDDAFVVPEVNALFSKPEDESTDWYLERQVERYRIAQEKNEASRTVILDGDPFQPLWYGWAYNYVAGQSLDFMEQFYKPKILAGKVAFPDLYIIFSASEDKLRNRRESDKARQRKNFEKHLGMVGPQQRYFRAMSGFSPGQVRFLKAETVHANVRFVQESITGINVRTENESLDLFEGMIGWLRKYKS